MYKHLYSRFLKAHVGISHFACHSHHYWPDVTRQAQLQYWDDSCEHVDDKWNFLFKQKIPLAQKLIAQVLKLSHPEQITFAQSTHELTYRLLTALPKNKKLRILTTDSEFYSFDRQINRFAENENVEIVKVATLPFETFHERFCDELAKSSWHLVFFSHVFFNSGLVSDFEKIVQAVCDENTLIVVDGYHGFMAVPTDLSRTQDRIYYLTGSYKYAQGGEGCCFITVPSTARLRPEYTGWFAEVEKLSAVGNEVGYPIGALQLAGSTMDFTPLYRLIAVLDLFKQEGLSTQVIHTHIQMCQDKFLQHLDQLKHEWINRDTLICDKLSNHGHFLTFQLPSTEKCSEVFAQLKSAGILTDSRGSRLRFGFGLYHDGDYRSLKF